MVLLSTKEDLQRLAHKLGMEKESCEGKTRARQIKAIRNNLAQKMDAQWFAIVKTELKKPLISDDVEDGEEETFEEVENHQSLGLTQAQKEFENMQRSFERMMQN